MGMTHKLSNRGGNMFDAIVFSNINALEFQEIRRNVIRIPEVIQRIREAQEIWDEHSRGGFELANFVSSDDSGFLGNLRLKNLATSVVQLGLLDRYLKNNSLPKFMVGLASGDSAIEVAARFKTFREMVSHSPAVAPARPQLVTEGSLPILAGVSLAEFTMLEREEHGFETRLESEMDLRKILGQLYEGGARKIVVVGPGAGQVQACLRDGRLPGMEAVDSVELDPVLQWFWNERAMTQTAAI